MLEQIVNNNVYPVFSRIKLPHRFKVGTQRTSAMTIIATLLFVIALSASLGVILLSIRNAMPRIREVIDMEFALSPQRDRRIILGEMRRLAPAEIIPFPAMSRAHNAPRLAA
jgi:hypothetical protein